MKKQNNEKASRENEPTKLDTDSLSAADTDHLKTQPGSEKVVPTRKRARADEPTPLPTSRIQRPNVIEPGTIE